MITPAYQNAKKANELASDVSNLIATTHRATKQRKNETLEAVLAETYSQ